MELFKNPILLVFAIGTMAISCAEPSDPSDGFVPGINPTSSIEGIWNSVNYDFSQKNLVNQQIDSVFSFTGPILIEDYKGNGEYHRKFLGFTEIHGYERIADRINIFQGTDTFQAKIITLSPTHFAYTIERNVVINDSTRFQFTSAQLQR